MDVDISTCSACKLSVIQLTGRIDSRAVLVALEQLTASEAWKPEFGQLWDYRAVTQLVVTQEQADRLVAQIEDRAVRLGAGRTAILVRSITHEAYANLLTRISKDPDRIQRTFRHHGKAIAWLQQTNAALQLEEHTTCSCTPSLV